MAEEVQYKHHESESKSQESGYSAAPKAEEHAAAAVEATDRGLFDFGRKKEEEKKCEGEKIASEFENKVQVCEDKKDYHHKEEDKKHESLLEKLHRSGSSSSSSSDEEEVGEDGQKKKKKKEKAKEKAEHKEEKPVEKCDDVPIQEHEEKKGFLDKIKEKLPGGKKAEGDAASPPPTPAGSAECAAAPEAEGKEKKGFLDKIKDKIPGYHSKSEEGKEQEKEAASH